MEKLKLMVASYALKKYALGYLVKGYSSLRGYKTQIAAAVGIAVWLAQITGYVTPEQAQILYGIVGAGGGMALLQKLQRYEPMVEEIAQKVKEKSLDKPVQ